MKRVRFSEDDIVRLLKRNKIATIDELKTALGTQVDLTVFRKLKRIAYHTSYSHRGSYYTMDKVARFSKEGLWEHRGVHFSIYGTLLSTAVAFVNKSETGHFADELEQLLQVGTKEALLKLVREKRIARQKMTGRYLYCSSERTRKNRQLAMRQALIVPPHLADYGIGQRSYHDEILASIILFFSLLDEKQRRLYAGLESLKMGHGGDAHIAEVLGIDPGTVIKGRQELMTQDIQFDRVRKSGGGRKSVEKKRLESRNE